MTSRTLLGMVLLFTLSAIPAVAQPDPNDQGAADSVYMFVSQTDISADDSTFTAELYFFNDEQNVVACSMGFEWDDPDMVMDSAVWESIPFGVFNSSKILYYEDDIDSTNIYRRFQCAGLRTVGDGLPTAATARKIATYYFHVENWTTADTASITIADFVAFHFVDPASDEYTPLWLGDYGVYDVNRPEPRYLDVSPASLDFEAVADQANPASRTFEVSEYAGHAIDYFCSTDAYWITLSNDVGTTPDDVIVGIDITGVLVGNYTDSVHVQSETAINDQWVIVNLTLEPGNRPPQLLESGPYTVREGEYVTFTVEGTDPDGDLLTVTADALPPGATFTDNGDNTGTFEWTPGFTSAGSYQIDFEVFDGEFSDVGFILITVTDANGFVLTPNPLEFTALLGEANPDPAPFTVSVVDGSVLGLEFHEEVPWLSAEQTGSEAPADIIVSIDIAGLAVGFYRDSIMVREPLPTGGGEGPEPIYEYVELTLTTNSVGGVIVDPLDNEIEGATVLLYDNFPTGEVLLSTTSSGIGGFFFDDITAEPFDLFAYKEGYYPGQMENVGFDEPGVRIVLEPLPEILVSNPPTFFVDYFCPDSSSTFLGAPIPVGSYVEAYTQDGLLVGQKRVTRPGVFGMFPVNRADVNLELSGAVAEDRLTFKINGMEAFADGDAEFPAGGYARVELCLEVAEKVVKQCDLFEGWNLISWNVNTATDDILTVLEPIMSYVDVILGYEQGGLTFDPDLQPWSTLREVDHLSAYWVRIEGVEVVSLTVTGRPVPETTPLLLYPGWNSISYLPEESRAIADALASVSAVTELVYGFPDKDIEIWEPGGNFNRLETLDPCHGYFIKVDEMIWLTYGEGPSVIPRTIPPIAAVSDFETTLDWVDLYSHDLTVDGRQVTTGTTVTAHTVMGDDLAGRFTMTTAGRFGFMPVYAAAASDLKPGDAFYLKVDEIATEEEFTWTNAGDRIEITGLSTANAVDEVLPQSYSLAQNYPNPFNPATRIVFALPRATKVKIEVFNVLGRSTAVIFEGRAAAGDNAVVWDGTDASGKPTASGVYFYRMTTDNYTATRKMVLLK